MRVQLLGAFQAVVAAATASVPAPNRIKDTPLSQSTDTVADAPPIVLGSEAERPLPVQPQIVVGSEAERPLPVQPQIVVGIEAERPLPGQPDALLFPAEMHSLDTPMSVPVPPASTRSLQRARTRSPSDMMLPLAELEPNTAALMQALMTARAAVFDLIKDNNFQRFLNHVTVNVRVSLSRQVAVWWTDPNLSCASFFTFPSPVGTIESRLHAGINVLLLLGALALDWYQALPWLFVYVAYGFVARALAGPRLCLTAFFVLFVLHPLLTRSSTRFRDDRFVPGPPRRFAQAMGAVLATTAVAIRFVWPGQAQWSWLVWSVLWAFLLVLTLTDFCIGCWVFQWLLRAHCCVPRQVRTECQRKYVRYVSRRWKKHKRAKANTVIHVHSSRAP